MQKKINKMIIFIIIILIVGLIGMGIYNKNKKSEYTTNMFYMDTYIYINLYNLSKKEAQKTFAEIEQIYKKYHELTNRYNEYEEINNIYYINHNNSKNDTLVIDKELYDIIKYGQEWYQKSNGLIDISMGNVIDVWKKYRESKNGIPSIEELTNSNTGSIDNIVLLDNNQIKNNHPNIDLGVIAKGYTTEIVGAYLEKKGITNYLINAGGNVLVGKPYQKTNFSIGLEDPNSDAGEIYKVIFANDMSVVTSGGYERFYEYNGKKYHHIINPKTLMPSNNMKSVSVIAKNSMEADMLSTLLFILTIDEGKDLLKQFSAEAVWYTNDNEIITSKGISKYEQK